MPFRCLAVLLLGLLPARGNPFFAMDTGIVFDEKVQEATRHSPDALVCYLALWRFVDYATETA